MSEISTILQYLALVAIGLLSVTIPTYALSITYLGRETESTLREIRRRREKISERLKVLNEELITEGTSKIEAEISRFKAEENTLRNRQFFLTAKGAAGLPLCLYLVCLALSIYGMVTNVADSRFIALAAAPFILGLYVLWNTLNAVEMAALRPEEKLLPAFKMTFAHGETVINLQASTNQDANVRFRNVGKAVAREVSMIVAFPPEFAIAVSPLPTQVRVERQNIEGDEISGVPVQGYTGIWVSDTVVYPNWTYDLYVSLTVPSEKRMYKIPVAVYSLESATAPTEEVLIINVV